MSAKILPAGNTHSIFERGVLALINNDFPRILTLLRKEQGFSQKKVAEDLGISQALLSHYEKGIRECGLNFVVKVADYYGVSCDYLLGRTPHRTGKKFTLNEVPDDSPARAKKNDSTQLEYNRRILVNSLNIVFAILRKIKSESLTNVVSHYLFSAVYKAFQMCIRDSLCFCRRSAHRRYQSAGNFVSPVFQTQWYNPQTQLFRCLLYTSRCV